MNDSPLQTAITGRRFPLLKSESKCIYVYEHRHIVFTYFLKKSNIFYCLKYVSKILLVNNSSVGNTSDLVMHCWGAHHCICGSNPDACERSLASHAIYTLIQCTPLLVEKAGVTPEVNLRNLLCAGKEASKWGNSPWLWTPEQTSPKVQNRDISGPTKKDLCPTKIFKKKKKTIKIQKW